MSFTPRVLRFQENRRGRDYVVGDLHGAFELLFEAMHAVGFVPGLDRIFSVGDLIDRGPDSADVNKILAIPGLHAIRGNHEHMLLELVDTFGIDSSVLLPHHLKNGLGWWATTPLDERRRIVEGIRQLPLVIQVATPRGSVGLVHADVPAGMHWEAFVAAIEHGNEDATHTALWSRDRYERQDTSGVAGVGRVLVGHTPMLSGVQQLGNVFYVDTGAVFATYGRGPGVGLTIAQLAMATGLLNGSKPLPTLLNVLDPVDVPSAPFSLPAPAAA